VELVLGDDVCIFPLSTYEVLNISKPGAVMDRLVLNQARLSLYPTAKQPEISHGCATTISGLSVPAGESHIQCLLASIQRLLWFCPSDSLGPTTIRFLNANFNYTALSFGRISPATPVGTLECTPSRTPDFSLLSTAFTSPWSPPSGRLTVSLLSTKASCTIAMGSAGDFIGSLVA